MSGDDYLRSGEAMAPEATQAISLAGKTGGMEFPPQAVGRVTRHAKYMLFVLVLASFLNYVDRQIIYIVGERIKQDLHLGDAQLGFLMGTSFAVFYGVTGIAMGRIADTVSRPKMLAWALALWSGLTALSGATVNFAMLAFARIGVGIGESAAKPCADPMIAEGFPVRHRATAMGIYLVGVHLGGAGSMLVGALILQHWGTICTYLPIGACAIADWRAAFLAVGIPGLLLAMLIYRLPETSPRKAISGKALLKVICHELSAAVPPFTIWNIHNAGRNLALSRNLAMAGVVAVLSWGLAVATGDWAQWTAVGLGAYSILSWGQAIRLRDRELFDRTLGGPVFLPVVLAGGLATCAQAAVGAWCAPYAMRILEAQPVTAGLYLGVASGLGAAIGAISGGWITDRWKTRDVRAPIWIMMISMIAPIPLLAIMLSATILDTFAIFFFFFQLLASLWAGVPGALAQDLVLPRMRGAAAASMALVMIVVSSGFGPYTAGKISEMTGSLATGIFSIQAVVPFAAALFLLAAKRMREELDRVHDLAAAASRHPSHGR